jgi:hypothetical protein
MKTSRSNSSPLPAIKGLLGIVLLCGGLSVPLRAEAPKSLLPAFANEGVEFTNKAQNNHVVKGWLPNEWTDNTEWAQVSATYTKLTDAPDKALGAVRIKVEKIDDGQLQLTTYKGIQKYKKGVRYVAAAWLRSADQTPVKVGVRQKGEPYEFYHEEDLTPGAEWKRFEFSFKPAMEVDAFLMFIVNQVGTVDVAGVTLEEKP